MTSGNLSGLVTTQRPTQRKVVLGGVRETGDGVSHHL